MSMQATSSGLPCEWHNYSLRWSRFRVILPLKIRGESCKRRSNRQFWRPKKRGVDERQHLLATLLWHGKKRDRHVFS